MHGPPEFTALLTWYFGFALAGVLYLFIGRKPLLSRVVATLAAVLVASILLFLLLKSPFASGGWHHGLTSLAFFFVPPLAWALAWFTFRRNKAKP
jgi:hypothetical protein